MIVSTTYQAYTNFPPQHEPILNQLNPDEFTLG